ncbi:MAG: hypothetical protein R3E65_00155 [Steroidobacteraceae bacterium]
MPKTTPSPSPRFSATENDQARNVLLSAHGYQRLNRRDRRAIDVEQLTDDQIASLHRAKMPDEYGHLDAELADWKP